MEFRDGLPLAQEPTGCAGAPSSRLHPPRAAPNPKGRAPRSANTTALEAGGATLLWAGSLTDMGLHDTSSPPRIALFSSSPRVIAAAPHHPTQHLGLSPREGNQRLRSSHGSRPQRPLGSSKRKSKGLRASGGRGLEIFTLDCSNCDWGVVPHVAHFIWSWPVSLPTGPRDLGVKH